MFGQGNPAPHPEASLQQLPPGAPQPFQQGGHGLGRPVMQQSGLMPPHPHIQQINQSGMPNVGLYAHGPRHNVGSNQGPYHYPPVQHNSQHPSQLGVQNLYQFPLPRSSLPPPPPRPPSASYGFQGSESLIPPPPPCGYVMHRGVSQPTTSGHQGFPHLQPPQQSHVISHSESSSLSTSNGSQKVFTNPPSPVPPVWLWPPSGLPGSDGKELTPAVVTSATESPSVLPSYVGCPDPVKKNGVDANNEPTPTSHKNGSSEKVDCINHEDETPVSLVNDSLAMDSKSELLRPGAGSSSHVNSSTGGDLCSTSDSDMDMEDDILNLVEDLETNDSRKDTNHENHEQAENLDAKEPGSVSGLPGEGDIYGHLHAQPRSINSPIKILQGYASDNSTEKPCAHNVKDISHAHPAIDESAILETVGEPNLASDGGSNNQCTAYEESNPVTTEHSLMQRQVTGYGKKTETDLKNSSKTFVSVGNPAKVANRDGSEDNLCDKSQHPSQVKGHFNPDDMTSKHGKSRVEDTTASLKLKVDEFGRLAKNVSSDSDSDDLHFSRIRGRRGRSRSISPFDRRRKTSMRRRYNRSRSRSHSPLRRRSRSRSPGYRRQAESLSEKRRRDKIQTSICFNFRDGRCHRGSSCRFLHHNSDKSGSSNSHRRKRLSEAGHGDKGSNFLERSKGTVDEMRSHRDDKDKNHGSRQLNRSRGANPDSGEDTNVTDKNDVGQGTAVVDRTELDQDAYTMVSYSHKRENVGVTAHVVEASMPQVAQDQSAINLPGDDKYQKSAQTCHPYDANSLPSPVSSSTVSSSKEPLGANHSAAMLQYDNLQPQKSNIYSESITVQHQRLGTPHLFTASDPRQDSMQSLSRSDATMDSRIQPVLFENPSSRVPSSVSGTPFAQATSGNCTSQPHGNFRVMQTSMGLPPFTPGGGPSYNQFSLPNQPPTRPTSLWTTLPPPPPRATIYADILNANNSTSGNTVPHHFEWNQQPQRTDVAAQSIPVPYSGHLHFNSQYGGNRDGYYRPSVEAPRPPFAFLAHMPDSLYTVNSHPQQTEGLHLERNNLTSIQGLVPPTFSAQPSYSFIGPLATEMLPLSETAFRVSYQSELNNTSLNDPRNSVPSDSRITGLCGKIESSSLRISANLGSSDISEFEHSRTSVHCNNASTSDRPLASILSQLQSVEAKSVEANGLREKFSSGVSIGNAKLNFPGSGGQQYDPLLDSLEKPSNSLLNSERVKKQHSTSDSDDMPRGIVSHKPLDVEETNRKKESEAIASLTSSDNEEFGETADADVGALENESLSNPVDMPNRDSEVAISETYPDKKNKDSRSMKLFKSAIANFVKEVLKPSWRQGNMSKEAFKTIVKKTVEKVSGAMKGHRYPKSHAKINHYIDSSEQKLTKLVMGYMDKYVKV